MSVRVVARIRPLLEKELGKDVIVHAESTEEGRHPTIVKIPNPKNESEEFSFAFNSVYDQPTGQEELFNAEVAPHLKALFQGLDVTIFAYGVTGTGKTHTMRGGLKLAERGVIPRLLSQVFRRGKKIGKDSGGETAVDVALSYYEIYNDKVYDLLEPPEKRTPSGLPLREKDGKTIVVGLSERDCRDLKDFERLYIEANNNRVTAATKLNAHSSRSHAILRVKVTQTTGDMVLESTASAIDLAGSEDNRRTDNGKERLVESAAINKSLFVLSQCVDAISRGEKRIPYRESKMTRILSLGQNNGITVMILNLAPLRSYHLDTLSSLNVSSRAKRIEVREIENEVTYKQPPRSTTLSAGSNISRQPLRPLANAHNVHTGSIAAKAADKPERPVKAFSVYMDRSRPAAPPAAPPAAATAAPKPALAAVTTSQLRRSNSHKRPSDSADPRPSKLVRPSQIALPRPVAPLPPPQQQQQAPAAGMSAEQIEAIIERKVAEALAARSQEQQQQQQQQQQALAPPPAAEAPQPPAQNEISEAVQRRLDALERRIDDTRHDDTRSEGLRYLLQARQHKEVGDDTAALRAYELALPFFPGQAKLLAKIDRLRAKLGIASPTRAAAPPSKKTKPSMVVVDNDYDDAEADVDDESFLPEKGSRAKSGASRKPRAARTAIRVVAATDDDEEMTPRKRQLLDIVNSRDVVLIRGLAGFGAKKAQDLVGYLELPGDELPDGKFETLAQLRLVPGLGGRLLDRAYEGLTGQT